MGKLNSQDRKLEVLLLDWTRDKVNLNQIDPIFFMRTLEEELASLKEDDYVSEEPAPKRQGWNSSRCSSEPENNSESDYSDYDSSDSKVVLKPPKMMESHRAKNHLTFRKRKIKTNKKRLAYTAQWKLDNRERVRETNKNWYKINKAYINAQSHEYYKNNKDYIKMRAKIYYANNKDDVNIHHRNYYKNNKKKVNQMRKNYYANNKDNINTCRRKLYANKKAFLELAAINYF